MAGGLNRFGDPNFRLVWGWSRYAWIGGKFEIDLNGERCSYVGEALEPKYTAALNMWHLEGWVPPEKFPARELWDIEFTKRIDGVWVRQLGPYPERGEYESITSFPPVELSSSLADLAVNLIKESRAMNHAERKQSAGFRAQRAEEKWSKETDDRLDDAMPAFYGRVHVAGFRQKENG